MWVNQIILALIGLSAGVVVAGGLFSFIIELGVVADFADRTHTADKILLYEDCVAVGGIVGNLMSVFQIHISGGMWLLPIFGLLTGVFVGCWAMALAEILNVFPIFVRRLKIVRYVSVFIVSMAVGKGLGAVLFFFQRW
ncbi:stage V sporulation protein AB [Luxibacter massiliensis]|uniref:stage V sporulation protein AB n=1 Tax=Luxibacter massiliensis TaxID=2219695 RepID=UPI000F046C03|nr:stage V sporulation protein AB [Luxibacter massiliensis]